ncbi:MAG: hypothetical protein QOD14_220 [Solirubrobacterales bacterium]|nr:hypothetical protein [Solirubrobacterales bacterium]
MIDPLWRARGFVGACSWAGALLATAGAILASAPAAQAGIVPSGFHDQVAFSGLTEPTTISFAPDGRMFVAEKSGLIKVFDGVGDTTPTTVADLRTDVYNYWDRGLLGMALDPQFPSRPYLYVLYTRDALPGGNSPYWGSPGATSDTCPDPPGANSDGCVVTGRLARLTLSGDVMTAQTNLITDWCQQFPTHSIGDLAFGPDGSLYVSGGDGASYGYVDWGQSGSPANPCGDPPGGTSLTPPTAEGGALRSQDARTTTDPTGLDGALLRVDPDTGQGRPGNPFAASGDLNQRRITAFGFRNPFRFTVRPGTGEIWAGDVGWQKKEEINRVINPADSTVDNFGWPCYEGAQRQPGYEGAGLNLCAGLYADGSALGPYYSYDHTDPVVAGESCNKSYGSSITGLAFDQGSVFPSSYQGALFFADYSRNCLWAMLPGASGLPDPANIVTFDAGAPGPVDLKFGPDGYLYYPDLNDGEIHRITYTAGNQAPTAVAQADPAYGPTPLTVQLDASGSTDPDGDTPLTYAWDLDGDGQFDDSFVASPTQTYSTAGDYHPSVRVTDTHGQSSTAAVDVQPGNTPPSAQIDTPSPGDLWKVGDQIAFTGSANDNEQSLPDSAYRWNIVLNHCPSACHQHPLQQFDGVTSGSFFAPDHEYPSSLTIRFTVTDGGGLTGTDSITIDPHTVQLTLRTVPDGLQLGLDEGVGASPQAETVIQDSEHTVSAPALQQMAGNSYLFKSWSDGGSATHTIAASHTAVLTATYGSDAGAPALSTSPVLEAPKKKSAKCRKHRKKSAAAAKAKCRKKGH